MRVALKTYTVLLVLLTGVALAATTPAGALADAGGSAAPAPAATTAPAPPHTGAVATWFGPGFYGRRTACGQTLTPGVIGVANRTLPCGTLVQITYKDHTLTVPVLDRGPYAHHASWDLTAGAAGALGITETVRIGTQVVGKTLNTPTLGLPSTSSSTALAGGSLAG
ncbi:MAG TPA: septal ring lytic transglycosylase RlpA family protein [Solirubrobacteraceae bacterium]|jgi:rare lipoprotein A|nr:septal ring lytic transglycosylase RlpA family protein [Solirubrobacteraceae bacterium]